MAPPFREAEFDIVYGKGISKTGCVLDIAVNLDIVNKSGAWFAYNGDKIGQGREAAKAFLEANPVVLAEIEKKVRDNYNQAFEKSLFEDEEDDDKPLDLELEEN